MKISFADYQVFADSPIFAGIDKEKSIKIIKEISELTRVEKGETVTLSNRLLCITKGKAEVKIQRNQKAVVKRLQKGEVFGCAMLFGGESVSSVTALCDLNLLSVREERMIELFYKEPEISLNYIRLLSEKIRFLNTRLGDFTSKDTVEKVLNFLKKAADEKGEIKISMTLLAKQLGIGRTSIYRALSELESESLITKNKNIITIVKE